MASKQRDLLVIRLVDMNLADVPDSNKSQRKYSFRIRVRNKLKKTRSLLKKEIQALTYYFGGVSAEEIFSVFLRTKVSLTTQTIEGIVSVPPEKGQLSKIVVDMKRREKPAGTILLEMGFFPNGMDATWEKLGLPQLTPADIISLDSGKGEESQVLFSEEEISDEEHEHSQRDEEGDRGLSIPQFDGEAIQALASEGTTERGNETRRNLLTTVFRKKRTGKTGLFLKRFGFTEEEILDVEFPACLLRQVNQSFVSMAGTVYYSTNYVSFYSNQYEMETIEKIPGRSIVNINLSVKGKEGTLYLTLDTGKVVQFVSTEKGGDQFSYLVQEWEKNKLCKTHVTTGTLQMQILDGEVELFDFPAPVTVSDPEEEAALKAISKSWEVASVRLPSGITVDKFLESIVRDHDFVCLYHSRRGDLDLSVSLWSPEGQMFSRKLQYRSKVKLKFPGVPPFASLVEYQVYRLLGKNHLEWRIVSIASGIPNGDVFRIETLWSVEGEEGGDVVVTGKSTCRFVKRSHMHGQITSAAFQIEGYSYKVWTETMLEFLSSHEAGHSEAEFVEEQKKSKASLEKEPSQSTQGGGEGGGEGGEGEGGGAGSDGVEVVSAEAVEQMLLSNLAELGKKKIPDTTVQIAFEKLFSNQSDLSLVLHKRRKDKDIVISDWVDGDHAGIKVRTTEFKFPMTSKIPGMPSEGSVSEKQRYYFTSPDQFILESKAITSGVPYCDYFETETKYTLDLTEDGGVLLVISGGVHFIKKTWIQGKIEGDTMAVQRDNTTIFLELTSDAFIPPPTVTKGEGGEENKQDYGPVIPQESSGFLESNLKECMSLFIPNITLEDFFAKYFSNSSSAFEEEYHKRRQETEVKLGTWAKDEKYGNFKETFYKTSSKLRVPGVPAMAPVIEKARFSLAPNWLEVEVLIQTKDIPYSDYFLAEQRWKAVPNNQGVSVTVLSGVKFVKKTWLQGKIEGETLKSIKESTEIWAEMVKKDLSIEGGGEKGEKGERGEVGGGVEDKGPVFALEESKREKEVSSTVFSLLGVEIDQKMMVICVLLFLYLLLFWRMGMLSARMAQLESVQLKYGEVSPDVCLPSPEE